MTAVRPCPSRPSDDGVSEFAVYTLADVGRWRAALDRLPSSTAKIWFTPEYHASWLGTLPGEPVCLHARVHGIEVVYPFFMAPIPGTAGYFDIASAYGYGGAIAGAPHDHRTQAAFDRLVSRWCREQRVVAEFVRECPGTAFRVSPSGGRRLVRYNLSVDLGRPLEEIMASFAGHVRRYIRRPLARGLCIERDEALVTLDEFRALYDRMAERAGFSSFYRFGVGYFEAVRRHLAGRAVLVNVRDGPRLVASALCLRGGDELSYHLGASDRDRSTWHPSELVYWAMIEEGHRQGCRWLRLGGGMSTAPDDTLYRFKAKFASHRTPVHISTFVHDRACYDRLCRAWEKAHPHLIPSKGEYFLRYRETD